MDLVRRHSRWIQLHFQSVSVCFTKVDARCIQHVLELNFVLLERELHRHNASLGLFRPTGRTFS